ncbi:MAG: UDP-4-amino-4,6-dideoxy-N-acetyl-beta-L-altrosamine transaminase [Rhodospirillaceae bacterium]|nr:UDP-4-amino-4,6-dideoxy-N-acetyl-beta-L-altrosamine transaminase [Rhodospirillaceae bacterium]
MTDDPKRPVYPAPGAQLPYGRQWIDDEDIAAVVSVLKGDFITQGPTVAAFENAFCAVTGARHAVAVSSGTAALHIAYLAAGLKPGDEIITAPITFAATANAARLCGAEVKFVDIDPRTLCIDAKAIARAVTPKTRIIAPVDFAGLPCATAEIMALAKTHNLTVVTDAAHSLGATDHGKPVGALAHMTCFSFHPVKSITTGEGGLVTTDDGTLAEKLRLLRSHGIKPGREGYTIAAAATDTETAAQPAESGDAAGWYMEMTTLGFNYRITDLQCALGLSQLKKLPMFVARRTAIAERYRAAFHNHPLLTLQDLPPGTTSGWHLFTIQLRLEEMKKTRRQVYDALKAAGLGVQIHYIPVHLHPYYRSRYGHKRGDFPLAEHYYDRCISLPIFPAMTEADAQKVVDTVLSVLN